MSIEIFYSYSHHDEWLRDQLENHLSILQRNNIISAWHDREITAGTEWSHEINDHINSAQLILLLISPHFLASDYCYDVEMMRAMERHKSNEARVIPVLLRPTDWDGAPFDKLQVLPQDARPVTLWDDCDSAFLNISNGIKDVIQELVLEQNIKLNGESIDSQTLYRLLLKLGFKQQAFLFRQAIHNEIVAAFLIHGPPEYGQRWLLNRLLVRYLPNYTTSKIITVNLARKVRRTDISSLWRDLGKRCWEGKSLFTPSDVALGIYNWWKTQDVILIFDDINFISEDCLKELIQEFWLPLSSHVRSSQNRENNQKLIIFLMDYQGTSENWTVPFVEKLDSKSAWEPYKPIRPPKLSKFSVPELSNWLNYGEDELPEEITYGIEMTVEGIMANSEEGVPELALKEICNRCGRDWYLELEKWLKV